MDSEPIHVLFICLGNICRSPLAASVFRRQVARAGLSDRFRVDSAGVSDYHTGEPPDPRMQETAARHHVTLRGSARQVKESDLQRADYVIAMDEENRAGLRSLSAARGGAPVHLMRAFDPETADEPDVPDPYYGGPDGFEHVYEMIERSCRALLDHIREERGL
ncbi:MAG TPA: low molecular weight protein-tyrosine-phosphatase [Longimicrobiales bacterium]|nr:low molecular weight protein-tyrosine-phosphatase [Longimicrobiales bacterium]